MDVLWKLDAHYKAQQRRFMGSMFAFALFCVSAIIFAVSGTTDDSMPMAVNVVLIVLALVLLPRNTAPPRWPEAWTPEEQDRIDLYRADLRTMQLRGTWMRLVYFGVVVVLLLGLPAMLP